MVRRGGRARRGLPARGARGRAPRDLLPARARRPLVDEGTALGGGSGGRAARDRALARSVRGVRRRTARQARRARAPPRRAPHLRRLLLGRPSRGVGARGRPLALRWAQGAVGAGARIRRGRASLEPPERAARRPLRRRTAPGGTSPSHPGREEARGRLRTGRDGRGERGRPVRLPVRRGQPARLHAPHDLRRARGRRRRAHDRRARLRRGRDTHRGRRGVVPGRGRRAAHALGARRASRATAASSR